MSIGEMLPTFGEMLPTFGEMFQGNLDECELTPEEREKGVDIKDLIA